jgi:hypothetical protein
MKNKMRIAQDFGKLQKSCLKAGLLSSEQPASISPIVTTRTALKLNQPCGRGIHGWC